MRIENPEQISTPPDGAPLESQPKWRLAFPIDWPNDEFRSRRDFTKLLGLTSFAFLAGQAWILLLSWRHRGRGLLPPVEIAEVAGVPVGGVKLFHYPSAIDPCLLVRISEEKFVAFSQKCTHLSCPVIPRPAEGRFYCPCHSGSFDLETGVPIAGPPRRPLPRILIEVRNGKVFASGVAQKEIV
jgi:nitrite reductase/ring-hydroxylating ferredoxin subunit